MVNFPLLTEIIRRARPGTKDYACRLSAIIIPYFVVSSSWLGSLHDSSNAACSHTLTEPRESSILAYFIAGSDNFKLYDLILNATGTKNASTAVKCRPDKNGPPNFPSPSSQSSSIRARSLSNDAGAFLSSTITPQFIGQMSRSAENPECISEDAHLAHALASPPSGQMPLCFSAKYSAIARESHIFLPSSTRHGTSPEGLNCLNASQLDPFLKGDSFSSKGMDSSAIKTQERNDQEE